MSEFDLIARHFAPLAGEGASDLKDDAALAFGQVITKDVLVEGTHFLRTDPLDGLAQKALRVNISDVIAKGAQPTGYLLGLVWRHDQTEDDVASFVRGLKADQETYALHLLGGDTTRGPAMMISVTMFGKPAPRGIVRRKGGESGDLLMVSGTIGDGLLGLEAARQGRADLASAYHRPRVRVELAAGVGSFAKAAIDVSDGLLADAGHLASASNVQLTISADAVPLSPSGRRAAEDGRLLDLLSGGDDYQVLCLVAPEDATRLQEAAHSVPLTVIGHAVSGTPGICLVDKNGQSMPVKKSGWDHFHQ